MDDPGRSVWFVGDLDDPWVAEIADALPDLTLRFACPGDIPDGLLDGADLPDTVVIHRAVLTRRDAARLNQLRSIRSPKVRVVLCFGPHTRHVDLQAWAALVDAMVPEATAVETIARRVAPGPESLRIPSDLRTRPRVAVVSTNAVFRETLLDVCEAAGYPAAPARQFVDAPAGGPALWDVPVLEPGWPEELNGRAKAGPVVALLGFADRALVRLAREAGASACLELPFDLHDLVGTLDRLTGPRGQPAHTVPPPPMARRKGSAARVVADPARDA